MEIVGSECVTALGTFPLPSVVPPLNAGIAEHVVAFSQHCVYLFHVATRTRQLRLKPKMSSSLTFYFPVVTAMLGKQRLHSTIDTYIADRKSKELSGVGVSGVKSGGLRME